MKCIKCNNIVDKSTYTCNNCGMKYEKKINAKFIGLLAFSIFIVLFFTFGMIKDVKKFSYIETTAKVISRSQYATTGSSLATYDTRIEYYVNEKRYETGLPLGTSEATIGNKVKIYYDPNNPEDISKDKSIFKSIIILAIDLFILVGIYVLIKDALTLTPVNEKNDESKDDKTDFEVKSKEFKFVSYDDYYIFGSFYFPYFKKECDLIYSKDIDTNYVDKAIRSICALNYNNFRNAIAGTVSSYNASLKKNGYNEYLDNSGIPIRVNDDNIMNFISLCEVEVFKNDDDSGFAYNISFSCSWAHEEMLTWTFRNGKNIYVGDAGDVNPFSNHYINVSEYNYSLERQKKILLTEEEYQEVEKNYNVKK